MDARHLRYFLAVVDHGTVSRAAEALYVAQPSVSQAIRTGSFAGPLPFRSDAAGLARRLVARRCGRLTVEGGGRPARG